jgi:sulfite exporter TauE/SafE
MAGMGVVSRAIDKLPTWAKVVLGAVAIAGGVYYIAQNGFWTFILHTIFSPEI